MPGTPLNLELAVRYYVDSVSYSAPMPPWIQWGPAFPYFGIAELLQEKMTGQLAPDRRLETRAYSISVPYRTKDFRTWVLPAVTEQIIVHACAMYISRKAEGNGIDHDRVYSYSNSPWDNDFLDEQLRQWLAFQKETTDRLNTSSHILQLDLRHAFANINRDDFYTYLDSWIDDRGVFRILKAYVNGWSGGRPGIPFVNDSLFYLGNLYLNKIDEILKRYSPNFIRFMDDYRIFGTSRTELEAVYEAFSRSLEDAGFSINDGKVVLGSTAEYFKAAAIATAREDARSRDAHERIEGGQSNSYLGPLLFTRVIDPVQLVELIGVVVDDPARYLTVRVGRLLLREIRKLRTNATAGSLIHKDFAEKLSKNDELRQKLRALVLHYANREGEEWRLIWLLYVLEDLIPLGDTSSPEYRLVADIARRPRLQQVARLWAIRLIRFPKVRHGAQEIFDHLDADYFTAGLRLYPEV